MTDFADLSIVLATLESPYYYGEEFEVALPTKVVDEYTQYTLLLQGETYSPVPYVVAKYKLISSNLEEGNFVYQFQGVEIK